MRRRDLCLGLMGGLLISPLAAAAQQVDRVWRIAVLMGYPEFDPQAQANAVALRQGLRALGWLEGQNIQIIFRWAGGDPEKAKVFAKELVDLSPDVLVPSTNQVTEIVQHQTRTIPVVFVYVGDPVGSGFAASLSRPGGNITGFANFENTIGGKWVELLQEAVPNLTARRLHLRPGCGTKCRLLRGSQSCRALSSGHRGSACIPQCGRYRALRVNVHPRTGR